MTRDTAVFRMTTLMSAAQGARLLLLPMASASSDLNRSVRITNSLFGISLSADRSSNEAIRQFGMIEEHLLDAVGTPSIKPARLSV